MNLFNKYKQEPKRQPFRNIKYLDPECMPREFKHRDNEMQAIAANMSPIFDKSIPIHTIIIGSNATGKTTAIQKILEQIREALPEAIAVYVNCRKHHTEYRIYAEIYEHVFKKPAPERGSNSQKIFTDIMKAVQITRQPMIIALDDMNYMIGSEEEASPHAQKVIRNLTRASESYKVNVGIYPVITDTKYRYKFDKEVSTLFIPEEVHFQPYTSQQYFEIIKERCDYVFYESIPTEVICRLVELVEEDNNIRLAWHLLKMMGLKMRDDDCVASLELLEEVQQK